MKSSKLPVIFPEVSKSSNRNIADNILDIDSLKPIPLPETSIANGIELAFDLMNSGKAAEKLNAYVNASNYL